MSTQKLFIPGPVTVSEPVLAATAGAMIDHRGSAFAALLERIANGMKPIFGTTSDVLVLGSSGTGGLEAAVANAFSPGQRVLACPVGVFGKRLIAVAKTWGLIVEVLETPVGHAVDPAALRARLSQPDGASFAGIMLTHNETSTGVQNDMAALSAAIGRHDALVIVDSVSGLGASDFQMDAWGFDVVVTASQKALAVPPGIALVAVSPRAWERMDAASGPRFYFDLRKAREFAALGQTPWTPPVSIAYALDAAIAIYHDAGAAHAYERHARYARAIRAGAEALGLELLSQPGAHSVTVVAMKIPTGIEAGAIRKELDRKFGFVIGGGQAELKGKILRIGTMGALSNDDIVAVIDALDTVLNDAGHPTERGRAAVAAAREVESGAIAAR
jgi:aspartate aminotransferase-like enzyme